MSDYNNEMDNIEMDLDHEKDYLEHVKHLKEEMDNDKPTPDKRLANSGQGSQLSKCSWLSEPCDNQSRGGATGFCEEHWKEFATPPGNPLFIYCVKCGKKTGTTGRLFCKREECINKR